MKYNIELKTSYSDEDLIAFPTHHMYINSPIEQIQNMIFAEMMNNTLPLTITLDIQGNDEETSIQSRTTIQTAR